MIVTTTPTVEGYPVSQYLRVVCGETIAGVNMLKDIAAGFRNMVGGRSESYERELIQARETALAEMIAEAGLKPEITHTDEKTPLVRTEADARLVSESLVTSDLWGHPSHGMLRLAWYVARVRSGPAGKAEVSRAREVGATIAAPMP